MSRRAALTAVAVLCLVLGTASATSLGSFDDVALDGTNVGPPCTGSVTLLTDDLLGGVLPLTPPITGLLPITQVDVGSLAGDCVGFEPVVVTVGQPVFGASPVQVLTVTRFAALTGTADVSFAVPPTDELADVLDGVARITEVRVGFDAP